MPDLVTLPDILAARERLRGTAVYTPLIRLEFARIRDAGFRLGPHTPEIFLKNEAAQPIGSFKLRGAYNKVAALKGREPVAFQRGVITFSSGNHAQGVAFAARALGTRAIIVMPDNAPAIKRAATEALGAEIVTVGPASTERKRKAEELVAQHGYSMIPPYDDPDIIAGQATCGLELFEQLAALDSPHHPIISTEADIRRRSGEIHNPNHAVISTEADIRRRSGEIRRPRPSEAQAPSTLVLSPVSGGGLLSGVATGLKLANEAAQHVAPLVWGCEPELAGDARESFYSKRLVEWPAEKTTRTLADGLRTQSLGQRNFDHILRFVDGIATVSEDEIRAATRLLLAATDIIPEPSGAVTLAAALFRANDLPKTHRVVAIISGGNIDPALLAELQTETTAETTRESLNALP